MSDTASTHPARVRPPIAILGVPFDNVTKEEAVAAIEKMILSGQPHYLATANVDFLVQAVGDVELRRILFDAHMVLCDGTPLVWVSRLLGNRLPERVAGADLVPLLIRVAANRGYRLFLLGAVPESAERAVANLRSKHPDLVIAGYYSPPFNKLLEMDHDQIRERISKAKPDILLVSFGCPKQEKWIAMHYRSLGVPVAVGVGATIDFLAGQVRRAPVWMQRTGTEWIFRLLQEPRRLFRRYVKDLVIFSWNIGLQWSQLRLRRRPKPLANRVDLEPLEGVQHVTAPDRLDLAAVSENQELQNLSPTPHEHCMFELQNVSFVDSTGVGILIRLHKQFRSAGRKLVLVAPSPAVLRALKLMRVDSFFNVVPSREAAQRLLEMADSIAVTVRRGTGATELAWHGELTAATANAVWATTQSELADSSSQNLVVDLSDVPFMDSSGLGLMVRTRKLARQQGQNVAFANLRPAVQNVVRISGLNEFLLERPAPKPDRASPTDLAGHSA